MASTFTPAGSPPAGVTPNFDDPPDSLYSAIIVTTSLIIAITTIFTACRLTARGMTARISMDDCTLLCLPVGCLLCADVCCRSADSSLVHQRRLQRGAHLAGPHGLWPACLGRARQRRNPNLSGIPLSLSHPLPHRRICVLNRSSKAGPSNSSTARSCGSPKRRCCSTCKASLRRSKAALSSSPSRS
jgi:hypothetical protein